MISSTGHRRPRLEGRIVDVLAASMMPWSSRLTERVHVVEGVLLEPRLAQVAGDFERQLLVLRERVLPDELDDLLQFRFLVERVDGPLARLRPVVSTFSTNHGSSCSW